MKKWKCSVCGYIHEGDTPPAICPICGASKDEFYLLEKDVIVKEKSSKSSFENQSPKRWICNVCGYIHEGDTPPTICPICGAPEDDFILVDELSAEKTKDIYVNTSGSLIVDIIVVGSGAGALSAATTAIDNGLKVVVLEKANRIGGTSRRSGGRYWIPNNYLQKEMGIIDKKEDAIAYMARYSFPTKFTKGKENYGLSIYQYEMLENYYNNATLMHDYFKNIGVFKSAMDMSWTGSPHVDYMQNLPENNNVRGRSIYPVTKSAQAASGNDLIELFHRWLKNRNADIRTNHHVNKVITNKNDQVVGVSAITSEGVKNFYAKKGVIFGTGGFSQNLDKVERFHPNPLVGGCAVPENQGDLIDISQDLGAMLGNMSGAFRAQSIYEEYIKNPGGASSTFYFIGDSFLQVNKFGKRVVNEKRNYNDRTLIHYVWDPVTASYPNEYMFFICDKRVFDYWGGFPPYPSGDLDKVSYLISGDSLDELSDNINLRLEKIRDYVKGFNLDENFKTSLNSTVERFNEFAKTGRDLDFGRGETIYDLEYASLAPFIPGVVWPDKDNKNNSMHPLSKNGPYYAIILAPGSLDTNGGPMTNISGQLLKTDYKPIDGIYGVGNCIASPGKNAYWGAGATLGPAMTYGYLAVNHAKDTKDKK